MMPRFSRAPYCENVARLLPCAPCNQIFTTNAARVSPHSTFRLYLQGRIGVTMREQFAILTALALHLNIDHSTLSQILRGKRLLSDRMIGRLGEQLAFDRPTIDAFTMREKLSSPQVHSSQSAIKQLAQDTVNVVSNICHFSILAHPLARVQTRFALDCACLELDG